MDSTSSAKQCEKVFAGQGSENITDADRSGQTDMVVQQPSSGELRLCELSQEPRMCELKEARGGAPKLRHGVRCSTLDYSMCMPNVQQMSATGIAPGLVQLQPQ